MVLAILQARMSSSRLPGKVLKQILGKPMLLWQIERVKRATTLESLVIATSNDASDDPIQQFCEKNGLDCFRGSLNDVLDRYYRAARERNAEHVVRLTGDCPLIDPLIIDRVVRYGMAGGFDYASNALEPTFPDGLDVEVFRFTCLETAWREATLPSQREHVTPFIHQQPDRFSIGVVKNETDLSYLRWTVDEPEDFRLVTEIYQALYPSNPCFDMEAVLGLMKKRPELGEINSRFTRNEGFQKSLALDQSNVKHT